MSKDETWIGLPEGAKRAMGAETIVVRQESENRGKLLQTMWGILLAICTALSGYALKTVTDHEGRLIRVETNASNMESILREIKDDIKEIKNRLPVR